MNVDGWMDERMNGWMDGVGLMDGWMDWWMDGQIDKWGGGEVLLIEPFWRKHTETKAQNMKEIWLAFLWVSLRLTQTSKLVSIAIIVAADLVSASGCDKQDG